MWLIQINFQWINLTVRWPRAHLSVASIFGVWIPHETLFWVLGKKSGFRPPSSPESSSFIFLYIMNLSKNWILSLLKNAHHTVSLSIKNSCKKHCCSHSDQSFETKDFDPTLCSCLLANPQPFWKVALFMSSVSFNVFKSYVDTFHTNWAQ